MSVLTVDQIRALLGGRNPRPPAAPGLPCTRVHVEDPATGRMTLVAVYDNPAPTIADAEWLAERALAAASTPGGHW